MKTCWAQYLFWLVILILGAGSILSACGQKGDLYLPDAAPAKTSSPDKSVEPPANKDLSAHSNKEPSS